MHVVIPPQHQGLRTLVLSFYLIIVKTVPKDDISNPQTLCQLEKWQVVLQSQCDALINLGFDPALKVRNINILLYLYAVPWPYNHINESTKGAEPSA